MLNSCPSIRRVARIWKREGGLFWKSETTASILDPKFHCSWIRILIKNHTKHRYFGQNRKYNGFSAQKQVISKKKGLHRNWDEFFGLNRKFKRSFSPKTGVLQKKKGLHRIWDGFFGQNWKLNGFSGRITATTSRFQHPNFFGGRMFSFFQQKSASKAQKTCDFAYFTSKWRGLEPLPAPPGYATAFYDSVKSCKNCNVFLLSPANQHSNPLHNKQIIHYITDDKSSFQFHS